MDAIVTYDLTKEYGENVSLSGVNLQVSQGEAFACVGGKNSGKTTLIRLLSGLTRPTFGECSVLGLSPSHEPQRLHQMVGTVLTEAKLYGAMTLWENLRFFAGLHGMDDNGALERSSFLLHKLDIWEGRDTRVDALPTGVVRRASLARALMHSPRALLVDEPSGGLDLETAGAIREMLSCVAQEEGVTLFLCTGNMAFAQLVCANYGILKDGVLLAKGNLDSLRRGAGIQFRAQLRLCEESRTPAGFSRNGPYWEKEIAAEKAMPEIISRMVGEGFSLLEARILSPTLEEIYTAYVTGGRREVLRENETGESEEPERESDQESRSRPEEFQQENVPGGDSGPASPEGSGEDEPI